MSLLTDALSQHASRLKASAGEVVTYTRGATSGTLTAVLGQSIFDDTTNDGETRIESRSIDFIVTPTDLAAAGITGTPLTGDRITRSNGQVFDVLPAARGSNWAWNDGHQTHLRIYTAKRV